MIDYIKRCIFRHMDFRTYFFRMTVAARADFARRCNTSSGHLRNIAYGKPCGEDLAICIDRESGGVITVEVLCPGVDWAYIRGSAFRRAAEASA